ncbi:MAG: DinB family protein, partial [Chloroflexi bacterium]|nr:DinB family protein [Chloroflexota bacterium]
EYFQLLYDYNYWVNHLILATAEKVSAEQFAAKNSSSYGSVRGTLVHTLAAEWVWLTRWHGESPAALLKEELFPTLAALRARWSEEENKMRAFIARLSQKDLARVIAYKNTRGEPFAYPLWQMLAHVVNHGTQHRAEAAAMLTDFGFSPGNIDLLVYMDELAHKK